MPTGTKTTIAGATLVVGLFGSFIPNGQMELLYSYKDDCTYQWSTVATTTREDPRPHVPSCTEGEYSVSVFRDDKGNLVYTEIPLTQYDDMGKRDGIKSNPTKEDKQSVFDLLFARRAQGAIAYNSFQNSGLSIASSVTFSASTTGSDALLAVTAVSNDAADSCRSATYNSAAMTYVDEQSQPGGGGRTERLVGFYIVPGTTGTFNVVVTCTGAISNGLTANAISYTGVHQTTPLNNAKRYGASATTSIAVSATTSVDGVWAVTGARSDAGSVTNGTNYFERQDGSIEMGDSNGSIGVAGQYQVQLGSPSGNTMMVSMFLAPSGGGTPETTVYTTLYTQGDLEMGGDIVIQ